jgi:hypothetical protein
MIEVLTVIGRRIRKVRVCREQGGECAHDPFNAT